MIFETEIRYNKRAFQEFQELRLNSCITLQSAQCVLWKNKSQARLMQHLLKAILYDFVKAATLRATFVAGIRMQNAEYSDSRIFEAYLVPYRALGMVFSRNSISNQLKILVTQSSASSYHLLILQSRRFLQQFSIHDAVNVTLTDQLESPRSISGLFRSQNHRNSASPE